MRSAVRALAGRLRSDNVGGLISETSMRFTYAESMCDPHQLIPLAQAAEDAGYTSFTVPDSICFPQDSDTLYPYNKDGNRQFLEGKPFIDPFALMAALGASTTTLRFATFVIKLPIRHPVLAAKQATSVAYLTRNRVTLGVGLSPWPEDYLVTGTEWKDRGARLDEMIEILRGLSTGEFFEYHGRFYDIPALKLCPVPDSMPILLGGHADAALRRAARLCDGWMHGGGNDDLDALLAALAQHRKREGTDKKDFEIHVISMDAYSVDGIRRLEDKGVTDAIVGFRNAYETDTTTLQQKLDALRGYADRVISKM
jgi:probable F420-dependent oxidoreductase